MSDRISIGIAGNIFAPALGELNAMGFSVSPGLIIAGEKTYRAESLTSVVTAPDTLQLLGLAILAERRGSNATRPTDAEIEALLNLDHAI